VQVKSSLSAEIVELDSKLTEEKMKTQNLVAERVCAYGNTS
jgi:hypothetical protein